MRKLWGFVWTILIRRFCPTDTLIIPAVRKNLWKSIRKQRFTCREGVFISHYNLFGKYIGVDPLLQQSSHIHYVDDSLEIDEELKLEAYHDRSVFLPVQTVIGGFHFMNLEDFVQMDSTAEKLLEYPLKYYTCHCTGLSQYQYLKEKMGDRLCYLGSGHTIMIS